MSGGGHETGGGDVGEPRNRRRAPDGEGSVGGSTPRRDFDELRNRLRELGRLPVPDPSPGFADRLENHLRSLHQGRVHPRGGRSGSPWSGAGSHSPLRPPVPGGATASESDSGRRRRPRRRRWPTTLVAAAFSAAAVMIGVGSLRGSNPEVRVSAASETVVRMPGGAVVEARPGLVVPDGAVLEVGPSGSVRFGDMSLGPGQRAIVDGGGLRIGRTDGGRMTALLGGDGDPVMTSEASPGGTPAARPGPGTGTGGADMVTTTVAVSPTSVTTEVPAVTTAVPTERPAPDPSRSTPTSAGTPSGDDSGTAEPEGDIGTASSQVREPGTVDPGDPPEPPSHTESATTTTTIAAPTPTETPAVEPADPNGTGDEIAEGGDPGVTQPDSAPCPSYTADEPSTTAVNGPDVPTTDTASTLPGSTTTVPTTTTAEGPVTTEAAAGSRSPATTTTAPVVSTTTTSSVVGDPSDPSVPSQLLASMTTEGTGDCLPPEVESVIQAVEDILTVVP